MPIPFSLLQKELRPQHKELQGFTISGICVVGPSFGIFEEFVVVDPSEIVETSLETVQVVDSSLTANQQNT